MEEHSCPYCESKFQDKEELSSHIDKYPINIVVNYDYAYGKTTSIKKGISSVSNNQSDFLFLSVDQPRKTTLINSVIDFHFQNKNFNKHQ